MRIPQGVTGFGSRHRVDPRKFKAACYEVARELGGSVSTFGVASVTPSFHVAVLALQPEPVAVLCNSIYPLIAFAEPFGEGTGELCFCSPPEAAEAFMRSGKFKCMTPEELNTPIGEVDLSGLSTAEMEQLRYWNPRRLGELVYNWWD